ncbi:DsbA family protein [Paraburkholderia sp. J7]|uniref:DsbA family protein n=1 Tax=Paraburkholderia sp. J7 TaxID=2805438 RepID=UPI002AB620FB|nr:DsbA family protein [Paraburkholderia sp. J7]
MSNTTLHYIYDPFCGWCFGAGPLLTEAREIEGLHVEPHSVGMLAGPRSKMMSPEWRDFVRPHEKRITAYSHVEFGAPYVNGTLEDPSVALDSGVPTAAMLAAEKLSGRGLEMLKRLQRAYYVEGLPISNREVILSLADELGYERQSFVKAFEDALHVTLESHIEASNQLLSRLNARGFPAFALEIGGELEALPVGRYFGRPEKFAADIRSKMATTQGEE